ncbi:hypothetical protein BJV78DRAFT_903804 [Lactifluus subvellereus]|nr:hypothetical protein BJV78DRAFT_903804 [Lactifluus subvellereus]
MARKMRKTQLLEFVGGEKIGAPCGVILLTSGCSTHPSANYMQLRGANRPLFSPIHDAFRHRKVYRTCFNYPHICEPYHRLQGEIEIGSPLIWLQCGWSLICCPSICYGHCAASPTYHALDTNTLIKLCRPLGRKGEDDYQHHHKGKADTN